MRGPWQPRRGSSRHVEIVAAVICALALAAPAVPEEPIALPELLEQLGRNAQLYVDSALRFTCLETITHFTDRGRREYKFDYIYVRSAGDRIADDYRLPRRRKAPRKARKKQPRPISIEDYDLPGVIKRPYMWVLLFDPAIQAGEHYRYELAGEAEVLGRRAIGLRFEPPGPFNPSVDAWFGTAWVDPESFQLLRVEAVHAREQAKKLRFESELRKSERARHPRRSTHLFQQVYTDYGIARNGLRFPSEVLLRRSRYEVWGSGDGNGFQEFPVHRVRQTYSDYRFFGVETEQEIRSPVAEDG